MTSPSVTNNQTATEDLLPLKDVLEADIAANDILLGRGGKTNHHSGNARYLTIIEARQVKYLFIGSRTDKTDFALRLVKDFRSEGIRFLKKDAKTSLWNDVGDTKMREKVSQNLREHQPKLKKEYDVKRGSEASPKSSMKKKKTLPANSAASLSPGNYCLSPGVTANMNAGGPYSPSNQNGQVPMSPEQMQCFQAQYAQQQQSQAQAAQVQQMHFRAKQQVMMQQQQMQMQRTASGGSNSSNFNTHNGGYYPPQQFSNVPILTPPLTGSNNINHQNGEQPPISYSDGGVMIQDNFGMDPLPFNSQGNTSMVNNTINDEQVGWGLLNDVDAAEIALLGPMGAQDHQLQMGYEEQYNQSNSTLTTEDDDYPIEPAPVSRGSGSSGVFFGSRRESYGSVDIAAAMGESTQSLLDSLRVDAVPEDEEYEDGRPMSPKAEMLENIAVIDEQYTPTTDNYSSTHQFSNNNPATVTPTVMSPSRPGDDLQNVLDNGVFDSWANSDYDPDDQLATHSFATANNGGSASVAMPFRRTCTAPTPNSHATMGGAAFRRTLTNPDHTTASPFDTMTGAPAVVSGRTPRKARADPNRARSPCAGTTTDRPSALTISKRATSNVNETPETRGHLVYQEEALGSATAPLRDSETSAGSGSSFGSIKKASLGRDTSARSHALKQQCMPDYFGSPTRDSTSTASTAGMSTSTTSNSTTGNGWPSALPLASADEATMSPVTPKAGNSGATQTTPKTGKMMVDFRKLALATTANPLTGGGGNGKRTTFSRTATSFEATLASDCRIEEAMKNPMNLMVQKPDPLKWRNRTTTIEALDLGSLEDDVVLQSEILADGSVRRPSRNSVNSISGEWAAMQPSLDMDDLVSDVAGQRLSAFLGQPSLREKRSPEISMPL